MFRHQVPYIVFAVDDRRADVKGFMPRLLIFQRHSAGARSIAHIDESPERAIGRDIVSRLFARRRQPAPRLIGDDESEAQADQRHLGDTPQETFRQFFADHFREPVTILREQRMRFINREVQRIEGTVTKSVTQRRNAARHRDVRYAEDRRRFQHIEGGHDVGAEDDFSRM